MILHLCLTSVSSLFYHHLSMACILALSSLQKAPLLALLSKLLWIPHHLFGVCQINFLSISIPTSCHLSLVLFQSRLLGIPSRLLCNLSYNNVNSTHWFHLACRMVCTWYFNFCRFRKSTFDLFHHRLELVLTVVSYTSYKSFSPKCSRFL